MKWMLCYACLPYLKTLSPCLSFIAFHSIPWKCPALLYLASNNLTNVYMYRVYLSIYPCSMCHLPYLLPPYSSCLLSLHEEKTRRWPVSPRCIYAVVIYPSSTRVGGCWLIRRRLISTLCFIRAQVCCNVPSFHVW